MSIFFIKVSTKNGLVWLQVPSEALQQRLPSSDESIQNSNFSLFATSGSSPHELNNSTREREVPQVSETTPSDSKVNSTEAVRVKFVLYGNDNFFRGARSLGMPVISASVGDGAVKDLTDPVTYFMETPDNMDLRLIRPICVFWDEKG